MKAVWIGQPILSLRFKALAAWRLFWSQGQTTRMALRAREIAELATAAADTLEALEKVFGAWLRPGSNSRRAQA